jgi:hypothetical protein
MADPFEVCHPKLFRQESAMLKRLGAEHFLLTVHLPNRVDRQLWKLPALDLKRHWLWLVQLED